MEGTNDFFSNISYSRIYAFAILTIFNAILNILNNNNSKNRDNSEKNTNVYK